MNNSRLEIKKITDSIKRNYEAAGITRLNVLQKQLDILEPIFIELSKKRNNLETPLTEEEQNQYNKYEETTMEVLMLQASLQGAFSFADTLLTKLGFLDEESTLDKNEKNLQGISGDNGIIKYTVSSTPNNN